MLIHLNPLFNEDEGNLFSGVSYPGPDHNRRRTITEGINRIDVATNNKKLEKLYPQLKNVSDTPKKEKPLHAY